MQGPRHRIVETEQQWPAGQEQLAGQCRPWIERKAARLCAGKPSIDHRQRHGPVEHGVGVQRTAVILEAGARCRANRQINMTQRRRQKGLARILGQPE